MKNKLALTLFASLLTAAAGHAMAADTSTDSLGVRTSTDPARAEQVERHAQELQAQQSQQGRHQGMAAHSSGTSSAKAGTHGGKHGKHAAKRHRGTSQGSTQKDKAAGGSATQQQ
jgi:hypothetical protein